MRVWTVRELGGIGALRLEDAPEPPAPGAGEVTVDVAVVALNHPDLLMLSGGYQYRPPLPFTPGMEGVGIVTAEGEGVTGLLGARVFLGSRAGLLRERLTLPIALLRTVPDALDDDEAAGFTTGALTAAVALERGRARAGERLLVLGAGGGMGLAAVAVGRHQGLHVVAAASDAAKLGAARAAGAGEAQLVGRDGAGLEALRDIDIVFDAVGGALSATAMRTLRRGGRHLVIGFVGGIAPVALNRLLLKEIEVVGVRAGEAGRQDAEAGRRHMSAVQALADARAWRPHIGLAVPMEEAPAAFEAMARGELVGKAVVRVAEPAG